MNYGYIESITDLHEYILGSKKVPYIFYNDSGNWEEYLPEYENQTTKLGQETSGCTVWGAQNQIETFYKFVYGEEQNFSERFTYNLVPIEPHKGTNPQNTYDTIRKYGLIPEADLPMTDSLKEYTNKFKITRTLLRKGQEFLKTHDIEPELLWDVRPDNYIEILKDALKTSPIGVSVTAWRRVSDEYVSDSGGNNHYCLLYKIDENGNPWVFDSYDHSKKKLSKDHNIRRAIRIWVNKKTQNASTKHVSLLMAILNKLMNKQTLLDICTQHLGVDVTPKDTVDDTVACVDTVSTLLGIVRRETPHMVSTIALNAWLKDYYMLVDVPQPEDIVISPTEGKRIGHVGIVMEDGLIASNNSFGINRGKFTKTHTLDTWTKYYKDKQKLPVFIYRYKI